MNKVENKLMNEAQTTGRKILDFLMGFLGSLLVGNLCLLLLAQFDPQLIWISYFKWSWRFVLAGLAVILFTRKKTWISIGIVAAILLQSF
jgi:hypothetical protein